MSPYRGGLVGPMPGLTNEGSYGARAPAGAGMTTMQPGSPFVKPALGGGGMAPAGYPAMPGMGAPALGPEMTFGNAGQIFNQYPGMAGRAAQPQNPFTLASNGAMSGGLGSLTRPPNSIVPGMNTMQPNVARMGGMGPGILGRRRP